MVQRSLATGLDALKHYMQIQPAVQNALDNGAPVVALESTIVAHGMPFPQNLELAMEVEEILKKKVQKKKHL